MFRTLKLSNMPSIKSAIRWETITIIRHGVCLCKAHIKVLEAHNTNKLGWRRSWWVKIVLPQIKVLLAKMKLKNNYDIETSSIAYLYHRSHERCRNSQYDKIGLPMWMFCWIEQQWENETCLRASLLLSNTISHTRPNFLYT